MRSIIIFLLACFCAASAWSQGQGSAWAGPDTTSCGEKGVMIGIATNPCPNCCYVWEPAEGLSCTSCKNPTARPKKANTVYTVTVISEHLAWKETDQVVVDLDFGEIHFKPGFLIQGSEDSVQAEILALNEDFDPDEIHWDFVGPDLGCLLEVGEVGSTAVVYPGAQYGTVSIEAQYFPIPGCRVTADLDVNNGVKDVWAIDETNQGRIAKTGETLVVLTDGNVRVRAIPNEGGFKNGNPDWKPDLYGTATPTDGYAEQVRFEDPQLEPGRLSEYIAGDEPGYVPKVTVIRKIPFPPLVVPLTVPGLDTLDKLLKKYVAFKDAPDIDPPCGSAFPFSISAGIANTYTTNEVEKYNDPGTDLKQAAKMVASVTASGKIFHPGFTKTFSVKAFGYDLFLCSRLYMELVGSLEANLEFESDPSKEDSGWTANDPTLTASIGVSGNLEFIATPPGYAIVASAKIGSSISFIFTYVDDADKLEWKVKVDPATASLSAKIQQESDMGKFEDVLGGKLNLSKDIVIFKGGEHGPWTLKQF